MSITANQIKKIKKECKKSLPSTLRLVGFGLNRVVGIDDSVIGKEMREKCQLSEYKDMEFQWGYKSNKTDALSVVLLSQYLSKEAVELLYATLSYYVFATIGLDNFDIDLKLNRIIEITFDSATVEEAKELMEKEECIKLNDSAIYRSELPEPKVGERKEIKIPGITAKQLKELNN